MKKSAWAAAALIAALVFSGCVLGVRDGDGGSITLSFAAAPGAKIPGAKAIGDEVAKVWLYAGGALLPGGPHSGLLTGGYGVVTIDNVPAGPDYRVVVYIRYEYESETPGDTFVDHYYALSQEPFAVSAGSETAVQLYPDYLEVVRAVDSITLEPIVLSFNSVQVYYPDGEAIAAGTSDAVYTGTMSLEFSEPDPFVVPVNSLSPGTDDTNYFVNGNDGVYYLGSEFSNWEFDEVPDPNVLQSAAYSNFYLYRAHEEFGGYSSSEGSTWVRINLGAGTGRQVLDMVPWEFAEPSETTFNGALVATNFAGAFIVHEEFFSPDNSINHLGAILDPAERQNVRDYLSSVDINFDLRMFADDPTWGPGRPRIQCFTFDKTESNLLYMGTSNGLYSARVEWQGVGDENILDEYEPPYLVPGSEGISIKKVVLRENYGGAVCLTTDGRVVALYNNQAIPLPFLSELVGAVNDIAIILPPSPQTYFLVAGREGLVSLQCGSIFPDIIW